MSFEYEVDYYTPTKSFGAGLFLTWGVSVAISVFSIICLWKVFKKAGKNGWEAIVPIYNLIVLIEISGLPMWYIALFFVPFVNIYAMFKIYIEVAHKFGKSTGFGVGMVFLAPIFFGILAFDEKAVYQSETPNSNTNQTVNNSSAQPTNVNNQGIISKYCPNCGNKIDGNSAFCGHCGNRL